MDGTTDGTSPTGVPWWAATAGTDETWWTGPELTAAAVDRTGDDVVLLADDGQVVGSAARAGVHDDSTPLHLAFSCFLSRTDGTLLVTRRALTKRTWPGVWTTSFCGHPRPGESLAAAIDRHAEHELGVTVRNVHPLHPTFRYRAVDPSGVVENEICPVFAAVSEGPVSAHPDEVMDHRWVAPEDLRRLVDVAPWAVSPWLVEQLHALGSDLLGPAGAEGPEGP